MNNVMKVTKLVSTNEKNSLEEAISTKTSSQFMFEGIDSNTNSKRMYMFTILYDTKEKKYQLMGDRYTVSNEKGEFIDKLKPMMIKMGFKEVSSNETFVNALYAEGTVISSTDENFDSLEEKSFDKQLRSTESEYNEFTDTIKTLSNEDLDLLQSEISEIYEKNKIPKYETRKRNIINIVSDIKKKRESIEVANKIVEGELEIPKQGNLIIDRLIDKLNSEWRKGVGRNQNFDTYEYNKAQEFFSNKEVVKLLEPLIEKVKGSLAGEKTFLTELEKEKMILEITSDLSVADAMKYKRQFDNLIIDIKNDIIGDTRRESFMYVLHYGDYGYTSTNNKLVIKDKYNAINEWRNIIDHTTGFATFATLNRHVVTGNGPDTFGKTEEIFITKEAFIRKISDSFSITRILAEYVKGQGEYIRNEDIIIDIDREKYNLGVTYNTLVEYVTQKGITYNEYNNYIIKLINGTFSKDGVKITVG